MKDVVQDCLEHTFVYLGGLCHGGVIWFGKRLHDQILGFSFEFSHLCLVDEVVLTLEGLREFDVEDSCVVSNLLVSNSTEVLHGYGPSHLDLALAPLYKSAPNHLVGCLTYDASHGVRVSTEVSLNRFVTKCLNIEVAIATLLIHIHYQKVKEEKYFIVISKFKKAPYIIFEIQNF